jgi:hypothetical protein
LTARISGRQAGIAAGGAFLYGLIWTAITWPRDGAASIGLGLAIWIATFFLGILAFGLRNNRRGSSLATGIQTALGRRVIWLVVGVFLAVAVAVGVYQLNR